MNIVIFIQWTSDVPPAAGGLYRIREEGKPWQVASPEAVSRLSQRRDIVFQWNNHLR